MTVALIILSCLLWAVSLWLLGHRQLLSPISSYLALLTISFARTHEGYPLLPINNVILIGWLCITLVVMTTILLQPEALQAQKRGVGYMTIGAVTGMTIGLLGFSFIGENISLIYSLMILSTAICTFLGFLFFTRTPEGVDVAPHTGRFFKYLLAKGFPVAITIMMLGVAAMLAVMQLENI